MWFDALQCFSRKVVEWGKLQNVFNGNGIENGFEVVKCNIDAVLDTTKKNAGIHSINVKIKSFSDENHLAEIRKELATEFEIEEEKIIIK